MTIAALAVTKTLSRQQVARIENLGGTVAWGAITATEDQLWQARINAGLRRLLEKRGNLALSRKFP